MSRAQYTFGEMNKQAMAVNHISYPEHENMISPPFPDRFLTLIRHRVVRRGHAESIRRRLFIVSRIVHREQDVC